MTKKKIGFRHVSVVFLPHPYHFALISLPKENRPCRPAVEAEAELSAAETEAESPFEAKLRNPPCLLAPRLTYS